MLENCQRIHFIAIGGSVMHSLALALQASGYQVSGSDDHIHEPARSRLAEAGLLPEAEGWFPERIHSQLDAVILGMHAKADNPELQTAQRLNLPIYSFPRLMGLLFQDKKQVVVAGSHGKTTITSMLMHVLKARGWHFDYMVGARVPGFANPVKVTPESQWAIIEGDEYPASCIDRAPKFLFYNPSMVILSGIAWDHINAYPTFEGYREAFRSLLRQLAVDTPVIFDGEDPHLPGMLEPFNQLQKIPYTRPEWHAADGNLFAKIRNTTYALPFTGTHNLKNMAAACTAANLMGLEKPECFEAMQSFGGAEKRLQLVTDKPGFRVFRDFAHAPSKVKATLTGLRDQFPERRLIAIIELHTFSSLNRDFLPEYYATLAPADEALVFINPQALKEKGDDQITKETVENAFGPKPKPVICFERAELIEQLKKQSYTGANVVLMSSGNFSGADLTSLFEQ